MLLVFIFLYDELIDPETNNPLSIILPDDLIAKQDSSFLSTDDHITEAFTMYGYSIHNGLDITKSAFQERHKNACYTNKHFYDEDKKRYWLC